MSKQRIVITGMGVLSPNGKSLPDYWNALTRGESGISYIKSFDTKDYDIKIGAEVKDFDPAAYILPAVYRKIDRFAQLGVCAAKMALDDAMLKITPENTHRIGVVIGTGLGGILFHEEEIISVMLEGGPSQIMASAVPRISPNSVSSYTAIAFKIKGPNYAVSTACSSGANAIGQGLMMIRAGMVDTCIVGGVEAPITPVTLAAYQALRCLSKHNKKPAQASKPFDRDRDGFVIGEGAGILVLENLQHAKDRKAKIYSELAGYGTSCGAYNMVAPQPDGLDAALAIKNALGDADISPIDVNYINAHGTSTSLNDVAETRAIKNVFGDLASSIPISSTKSMIGHTIGAAGAIEAIASVLTIKHQTIHPTINLNNPDPDCDLDYTPNNSRKHPIKSVISNSFGFGSNNAVLAIKQIGD